MAAGSIAYTPPHLAEQAALEARGDPDGERKTITALFADIKGSMNLLQDLDPEDGAPGVSGRKFTVSPSALVFTDLP